MLPAAALLLTVAGLCMVLPIRNASTAATALKHLVLDVSTASFNGKVQLEALPVNKATALYLISRTGDTLDRKMYRFPITKLDTIDIDNDGRPEILMGIIKPTTFDLNEKLRMFILRIDSSAIKPFYLCSNTINTLKDFCPSKKLKNTIVTTEQISQSQWRLGYYRWAGFGLRLQNYSLPFSEQSQAIKEMYNE